MTAPDAPQNVFDVQTVRQLVELMKEHDLSEMDIQQGDAKIQLRRAGLVAAPAAAPAAYVPAPVAVAAPAAAASASADDSRLVTIKSPMVGTFYSSPDPDSAPYVKVGDHVGRETTVCIVEAMKVFNQIPAEATGKIVAVLAESGQSVEFGQPLYKVDPAG